tara:strand:+ start:1 stop:1170 length:1170 start_codon:yes stop_codon:yes gene_type:complete
MFGTGGANRIKIDSSGNLLPDTNDAYNLGSSSLKWANVHIDNYVYVGTTASSFKDNQLLFKSSSTAYIDHNTAGQAIQFRVSSSGGSALDTNAMLVKSDGTLLLFGSGNSSALELNPGSNAGSLVFSRNGHITSNIRASDGGSNIAGGSGGGSRISILKTGIFFRTFPSVSNIGDSVTFTDRATVTPGGQFMIGTTSNNSANHKLIVSGDGVPSYYVNGAGLLVAVTNSNDTHCAEFFQGRYNRRCITHSHSNTGSVTFDVFEQADTNVGSITANGSNTAFNTSSDYRLKENIVNITDGITRLKQLIPRRFNWISDSTNTLEDGFIAHEVSPVLPQAVVGEKDAVEEDGSIEPQAMDYSKLTPLLTAALQEAIAKIETLESEVAALKSS